ncbi:transcription initiation factor IID, 18kD subunit-domain-containing protein, partial [Blyttiomyces helicus]
KMMFVFGEVQEPLDETTLLVEQITRNQIIEVVKQSIAHSAKRGSRYLSGEDVIFLIRHDVYKVHRLRAFLSWKDVRKNVSEGDRGGPQGIEDEQIEQLDAPGACSTKKKAKVSWDVMTMYNNMLSDDDEDEQDEEERQALEDQVERLRIADEVTRTMTKEEYLYYSDCRQASFTFKKAKRFRDWSLLSTYYDAKPQAEVLDSLGFFAYEIVAKLTEMGLAVKREADARARASAGGAQAQRSSYGDTSLFGKSDNEQTPLNPAHIREAFRRLQQSAASTLGSFNGGLVRTSVSLI